MKKDKRLVIPRSDTHPGPKLEYLNGKVEEVDDRVMLGEDENS